MKDKIQERMNALKQELEKGQQRLTELQNEEGQLRQIMLRISGAIQVMEEMLTEEEGQAA